MLDAAANDVAFSLGGGETNVAEAYRKEETEREEVTPTTGMTCVTPSPLSITVPVSVRSPTCRDVQEAASAKTACTKELNNTGLLTKHIRVNNQYHGNLPTQGYQLTPWCY